MRVRSLGGALSLALLLSSSSSAQNAPVTINVDVELNRHLIDPRIYGTSFASPALMTDAGVTMNRWGGNAMSRYNWAISTANRCKDYFFENIPEGPGDGADGASADQFIGATFAAGAQPIITIPMMGLLPKDRVVRCGFSVAKYGAQESAHGDCGNGKRPDPDGTRIRFINDPADTSAVFTSAHQVNWVQHLMTRWGGAAAGGVRYYAYDNEPVLWSFDHWDVHPNGSTYDEVWAKMMDYGPKIKAADPAALLLGPEEWGWSGYFGSGLDAENGNSADRDAHGGTPYVVWLLQQAAAYEQQNGQRILDVFTLHFYPQSGEFGDDTSPAMQTLRNRSTRSMWDPNYVDQSWIGGTGIDGGRVRLIPRLKEWVEQNYPGTRIGITEYNWGADNHINGGTAQADLLGIFGREGLDMAVRWDPPPDGSYTYNAFKMYRNYDGTQSRFGEISVSAMGPNVDEIAPFAALRSAGNALTILMVAKVLSGDTPATVNLANFAPAGAAQRWQLDSANVIQRLTDVAAAGSSLSLTLPPQTITLLVVPGGVKGDVNADGAVSVADLFYLINFLFSAGPSPRGSADQNSDGGINVADVMYLINFLFAGGPAPM